VLSHAANAGRHSLVDRKDDLYETPACAARALLAVEQLPEGAIWEPACGPGAIVRVLRAAGHEVWSTDLVDYGSPDQDQAGIEFLMEPAPRRISSARLSPIHHSSWPINSCGTRCCCARACTCCCGLRFSKANGVTQSSNPAG
jgi:hypothetical protein